MASQSLESRLIPVEQAVALVALLEDVYVHAGEPRPAPTFSLCPLRLCGEAPCPTRPSLRTALISTPCKIPALPLVHNL